MIVKKISLETLMDIIHVLYDNGVDYIDLSIGMEDDMETLYMNFPKEYMDEEYQDNYTMFYPESEEQGKPIKLTDEDLNNLL